MTSYKLVMPEDMNHYGFLFGGKMLMDGRVERLPGNALRDGRHERGVLQEKRASQVRAALHDRAQACRANVSDLPY